MLLAHNTKSTKQNYDRRNTRAVRDREAAQPLALGARGLQPGVAGSYSIARSAARRRAEFSSAARRGPQPGDVRSFLRRVPAGEGAEAHDLKPGEVFRVSAWAKARRPVGPQPGVVAMCSSVRVGVGKRSVA